MAICCHLPRYRALALFNFTQFNIDDFDYQYYGNHSGIWVSWNKLFTNNFIGTEFGLRFTELTKYHGKFSTGTLAEMPTNSIAPCCWTIQVYVHCLSFVNVGKILEMENKFSSANKLWANSLDVKKRFQFETIGICIGKFLHLCPVLKTFMLIIIVIHELHFAFFRECT